MTTSLTLQHLKLTPADVQRIAARCGCVRVHRELTSQELDAIGKKKPWGIMSNCKRKKVKA